VDDEREESKEKTRATPTQDEVNQCWRNCDEVDGSEAGAACRNRVR